MLAGELPGWQCTLCPLCNRVLLHAKPAPAWRNRSGCLWLIAQLASLDVHRLLHPRLILSPSTSIFGPIETGMNECQNRNRCSAANNKKIKTSRERSENWHNEHELKSNRSESLPPSPTPHQSCVVYILHTDTSSTISYIIPINF